MITDADLGERVRQLRVEKGLTQSDVETAMAAHGIRWHQSTVYKIETAERKIQATELFALSAVLDVPVDQFNPGQSVENQIARLERRVTDIARIRSNLEYEAQGITDHINKLKEQS